MMESKNNPAFGIYIHIPFCLKKCDYCDFFSVQTDRSAVPHKEYLDALVRQLETSSLENDIGGRGVDSVYFGGGTPSLMPPEFFERALAEIKNTFRVRPDAEISCEANPATIDCAWLCAARHAGITRLSIGVQSFDERLLSTLGRIHSGHEAMQAIAEAQDTGFKSVGIDMIYAIPGETAADLENDIRTAMTFQPEHISAYQLTLEEGTPLAKNLDPHTETDESGQLKQMRIVSRMLARGGWNRYEISNFAKPGFECAHNANYWRYGEYLGLGAGATSFSWRTGDCHACPERSEGSPGPRNDTSRARRWTQARDINEYISGDAALAETEQIDTRTAMGEFCFMGLRMSEGISKARFREMFETPFDRIFGLDSEKLASDGLIRDDGDRITLTDKGVELSNVVFRYFV